MVSDASKSNNLLRRQRKLRGWTLNDAASVLYSLCVDQGEVRGRGDINAQMMSVWERGKHRPSPFWQKKLCELYGKSTEELGFLEEREAAERSSIDPAVRALPPLPTVQIPAHQAPDRLQGLADGTTEQQLGAWLVVSAGDLTHLLAEGWSVEEVLATLKIVLKVVQGMPMVTRQITRRKLLQFGAAALVGGIPIPSGTHVSFEERVRLHSALGESIAAGWKLFHTAGNAQVLALGQAQLYLIQQTHSLLASRERNMFYTSTYNLIGKSLHFQEYYQEALDAHVNAHVAAMGTGDPWYIAQSLICQADSRQALGQHVKAIQTIEEALHILGDPTEETLLRSKAHLLGCWADNAMTIGESTIAQKKLEASARYLDQISLNEEFDRANWYQLAGKYAFMTEDYPTAIQHFKEALAGLPPSWIIRQILVLLPMMATYAHQQDREASFATANKALSAIHALNAPSMNRTFRDSVQGLLQAFPHDSQVRTFVASTLQELPQRHS